jgi:hypothetical protein
MEMKIETTYNVAILLLKLVDYHLEILKQELELKMRKEKEIIKEIDCYSYLKIKLLLYLGINNKEIKMRFEEQDILMLGEVCYLFFIVTKKIINVEKKVVEELKQFHIKLEKCINIIDDNASKNLN